MGNKYSEIGDMANEIDTLKWIGIGRGAKFEVNSLGVIRQSCLKPKLSNVSLNDISLHIQGATEVQW